LGRQLFLGDNLDAGRLEASFDQGILTLTVPVAEQAKPRRIEISARSQGGPGSAARAGQRGAWLQWLNPRLDRPNQVMAWAA
jgi:Hsp20/alpha crystallin family